MYINYAYIYKHTDQNTVFVDIVFEWIAATCSLKLTYPKSGRSGGEGRWI